MIVIIIVLRCAKNESLLIGYNGMTVWYKDIEIPKNILQSAFGAKFMRKSTQALCRNLKKIVLWIRQNKQADWPAKYFSKRIPAPQIPIKK